MLPRDGLAGDADPYNGVVDNTFGAPTFTGTNFTSQGALAVQFSLRDHRVAVTLTGPRDAAEVETSIRHAQMPLPPGIWEELDLFLKTLGPWTPGGEAGVLA